MTINNKTLQHDALVMSSQKENEIFKQFTNHFKDSPLPEDEIISNLGLFLNSKSLARILFFYEIYQEILCHHGIIAEFGVRWGQSLSIMSALRGIFEPFNRCRKIVGFDTFSGFAGVCSEDGKLNNCAEGSFAVPDNYENYLGEVLSIQEKMNPMSHIKRHELIKGDAVITVPDYLKAHPETIVSLAIFDFDIYAPTKATLEAIKPHLTKGSILVFDELCDEYFPGETLALREVMDLGSLEVKRLPFGGRMSYIQL